MCIAGCFGISRGQTAEDLMPMLADALNKEFVKEKDSPFNGCSYDNGQLVFNVTPGSQVNEDILSIPDYGDQEEYLAYFFGNIMQGDGENILMLMETAKTPATVLVPVPGSDTPWTFTLRPYQIREKVDELKADMAAED